MTSLFLVHKTYLMQSLLPARSPILRSIYRKSVPPTRPVYLVFLAFHMWPFFLLFVELAKRTVVIGRGGAYAGLSLAGSVVTQDMACYGRLGCSSLARNRGGSTRLAKRFSCRPHHSQAPCPTSTCYRGAVIILTDEKQPSNTNLLLLFQPQKSLVTLALQHGIPGIFVCGEIRQARTIVIPIS